MTARLVDLGAARGRLWDMGYAAGWGLVKAVPGPVAGAGFRVAADVATRRDGGGVRQLRKNLRRVMGADLSAAQLEQLTRDGMRSYARYWLETFRLPTMDRAEVVRRIGACTIGARHVDEAIDAGRGYILALPHMANYDAAALWLIDRYRQPFSTVMERLEPRSLFDRFIAYRRSLGMDVLPLTGGAAAPVHALTERLRANGGVCLVADRDLSRSGIEVQLFGETAKMPPGPALLAATTGAALLPVGLWFMPDGGWAQRINPPVVLPSGRLADRVRAGTQALADAFAAEIADHPSDWHMLQRIWVADLATLAVPSALPEAPAVGPAGAAPADVVG
jgi:phosphatidylinositol dimannoside acyltransferase